MSEISSTPGSYRISMEITFLGTNGWYDTGTGNTPCVLIQSQDYDIILDAGYGIAKADRYLSGKRPVHLFLSHFHIDHIAGLHTLAKFRFPEGLFIYGQPGTPEILNSIVRLPFTVPFDRLPYPVRIIGLDEGDHTVPFPAESRYLVHPVPCFGYRFQLEGKIIAFCTDTGYCENAVHLGRDADLLITECAFRSGQDTSDWPHLRPEDTVRIAREAGATRLALMHFDASLYPSLADRREIADRFKGDFPGLMVAEDGMQIRI
ncbi:MAG: ribonuclease Z [Methanoregulaceae archaeon]